MSILDLFRKSKPSKLSARYEASQTTADNKHTWELADNMSADTLNNPETRKLLRNRAREEIQNNSYARGMMLTLSGDTVGTGPRLQVVSGVDTVTADFIERSFSRWKKTVNLDSKLFTMRMAKGIDGEAFALFTDNPKLKNPVTLDILLVESDRFENPYYERNKYVPVQDSIVIDGVVLDMHDNVIKYYMYDHHPGDMYAQSIITPIELDACDVIHYFRADRPEQHRGVSEMAPSLNLFAQLRRYTEAVLAAAETAADFAAVIQTNSSAPISEVDEVVAMDQVPLVKRMAITLPAGYELGQLDTKQPTTTYGDFKRELLAEIGRCHNIPVNILTGDSSKHNYSSARLDLQMYNKAISIEQKRLNESVVLPIFRRWLEEAILVYPELRGKIQDVDNVTAHVYWDGREHVDPTKEVQASTMRIQNLTSNLAIECARYNLDWKDVLTQASREKQLMQELGIQSVAMPVTEQPKEEEEEEVNNEEQS